MKKIGIIGAMELEVETLKSKMNVVKTTKKANMEFFEGTLNGVGVVIVRSGIGKVNAGICTQILAVDGFADIINNFITDNKMTRVRQVTDNADSIVDFLYAVCPFHLVF